MELRDVLPIVVPGTLIQVLIQAYYIKHCLENAQLSQRQKALYIIAIAVLNLPAAAVYLLSTRRKTGEQRDECPDIEVDGQTRQGIFVLLVIAYEIFSLRIMTENLGNEHYRTIIGLLASSFAVMIVNELLVRRLHHSLHLFLPVIQVALVLPVEFLDAQHSAQLAVLVTVGSLINAVPLRLAWTYSIAAFCGYLAVSVGKVFSLYGAVFSDEVISYVYVNMLVFLLVAAAFYTLKKLQLTNERLRIALQTLRQQSLQLEQMSAVTERNRIAGEIHDTVGHSLTSAVIAIEAGESLLRKDEPAALQKLALAKEQVKRGLGDIRNSVRAIREGGELALLPEITRLLAKIRHNTGLMVNSVIEIESELLPVQQSVILRAITECATNSLKHGNSSEADLLLQEHKGSVQLTFSDNGHGTDEVSFGFGLRSMEERVRGIGGTLQVESAKGEGFTLSITIPTGTKMGGRQR